MRELILAKNKLYKESVILNDLAKDEKYDCFKLKELEVKKYKKWKFYNELIKEMGKRK